MGEHVFHAYDVRALVGDEEGQINADVAYKIGNACAKYSKAKTIFVCRDARTHSEELKNALAKGITDAGCDVVDFGMYPSPYLFCQVGLQDGEFGIVVTASHNSKEYNGFKIYGKGPFMYYKENGLLDIKEVYDQNELLISENKGQVKEAPTNAMADYLKNIEKYYEVPKDKKVKIVIDSGNGVGFTTAKEFFKDKDNIEVVELYCEPDGTFPNHQANPVYFYTLEDLQEKVIEEKADLGIAYDGDADRVVFVDKEGEIILTDYAACVLYEYELDYIKRRDRKEVENKNLFIDLGYSKSVEDFANELGGKATRVKVGNPYYKDALAQNGGVLASEFSGHIIFPENFNADDALVATIKMINAVARGADLPNYRKKLHKYHQHNWNQEVADKDGILEKIKSDFASEELTYLDGVTVTSKEGWWFNVRKSNTEPLLRFRIEGKDKAEVDEIEKRISSLTN